MPIAPPFTDLRDTITATVQAAVNEDEAYFAEAEKRKRLAVQLEMVRIALMEMTARLNEGTGCRLPYEQQMAFDRVADPYLAANRMSEAFSRIVMLEMRVNEDIETKAKRQAEEQARREREIQAAERRKAEAAAEQKSEAKEDLVRRATGFAHRQAFPRLDLGHRQDLLNGLLEEFEEFAGYDDDPLDIVSAFCRDFARDPDADLSDIPAFEPKIGEPADAEERLRRQCRAWAAACLERFLPKATVEALTPPELRNSA